MYIVGLTLYIYIYICVCVYMCIYIYIYIHLYTHTYISETQTHIFRERERDRHRQTDTYTHPYIDAHTHTHRAQRYPTSAGLIWTPARGPNGWYSFYETATRDMEVDIQRSFALLYWLLCISMHGFFSMEPCLHLNVIVTQAPFTFWRRPRLRWPATVAFVSPSMEAQKGLVSLIRPRFVIYGFFCFWPRTR